MQRNKPGMEGIASKIYKGLYWKKVELTVPNLKSRVAFLVTTKKAVT